MRLRKKKNLNARIDACGKMIVRGEGYDFYDHPVSARADLVNLAEVFKNDNAVHLEIGCGKGGFVRQIALAKPNINFVAVEKLSNIIVEACEKTAAAKITNVRFVNCGAENLLYFLQPSSISAIYLNFSCPFPKKSYANRRLTSQKYLEIYKQILKEDGVISQKTDNNDFFDFSILQYKQNGFYVYDMTYDLYNSPFINGNVPTEYETKFIGIGKKICALKAKMK